MKLGMIALYAPLFRRKKVSHLIFDIGGNFESNIADDLKFAYFLKTYCEFLKKKFTTQEKVFIL